MASDPPLGLESLAGLPPAEDFRLVAEPFSQRLRAAKRARAVDLPVYPPRRHAGWD